MSNQELQDWLTRTLSDYAVLTRAMDNAKLGEYDTIRQCASFINDNLDELANKLAVPTDTNTKEE